MPIRLLRKEPRPTQRPGRAARAPAEGRFSRFVRETKSEFKKVTWPTREQATNLTLIVIAVSVVVGIFMGSVDFLFKELFGVLLGAR